MCMFFFNFRVIEPEVILSTDEKIDQTQSKFDETATRVEQLFFTNQYQNACSDIEKVVFVSFFESLFDVFSLFPIVSL